MSIIGYRSIGEDEFGMLMFSNNPIYGKRIWCNKEECGCPKTNYGVVCFFAEHWRWKDKLHQFDIVVNLKNPLKGHGKYLLSNESIKNKIWTGRDGQQEILIPELYTRYYSLSDVISIDTHHYYNKEFTGKLIDICNKNNINFLG